MILINVKYKVKPEYVENFRELVDEFTQATRAEEGNIFFDWYRSTDEPDVYILTEAFKDDAAEAHVSSAHFKKACTDMVKLLVETPVVINTLIPGKTEWDLLAEMPVEN
ncbi:MAG: putative quinol monooxygenase [Corynebacterium sp.]|nr:putative quinol monooxygenase [Corynebacterium sp.]